MNSNLPLSFFLKRLKYAKRKPINLTGTRNIRIECFRRNEYGFLTMSNENLIGEKPMKETQDQRVELFLYEGKMHKHLIRQQPTFLTARIGTDGMWTVDDGDLTKDKTVLENKVYLDREIPKRQPTLVKTEHGEIARCRPFVFQVKPLGREGISALIDKWKGLPMKEQVSNYLSEIQSLKEVLDGLHGN